MWSSQLVLPCVVAMFLVSVPCHSSAQTDLCRNKNPVLVDNSCTRVLSYCEDFYQFTTYPNNISTSSREADETVLKYQAFFSSSSVVGCSPYSILFVCLALSPQCGDAAGGPSVSRSPCASLCDLVLSSCRSQLEARGGLEIDSACLLHCNRYPSTGCVDVNDPLAQRVAPPINSFTTVSTPVTTKKSVMAGVNTSSGILCTNASYFTDSAKDFALGWLTFWSVICFVSTALTISTFLLDPSRFQYPWRPIVYLALSFNLHSLTHLFAMALGRDLVTSPGNEFVRTCTSITWTWGHTPCILIFGLLYFTMMAAFLWWLMLSLSWFLASAFSWSNEAVAHLAPFYHVIAWIFPLLLTIILVATRVVGADELTAICFVVHDNSTMSYYALLLGVIVPLIICLVTGSVFLSIGFVSLLRIHSIMRHRGKSRESTILEKLMIRIGVFVVVFIIPAMVVIGCFLYELLSRPYWTPITEPCADNCTLANPAVFMVRLFMFLLTGILSGVWIWSRKTILSWKNIPQRLAICCKCSATSPGAVNIGHIEAIASEALEQETSNNF